MNIYQSLKKSLNLQFNIVGLKLMFENEADVKIEKDFFEIKEKDRFSRYIKRAARGEYLKIHNKFTNCIAKKGSENGPALSDHVEMEMKLNIRGLKSILLFPINKNPEIKIDSVILIVTPLECTRIIEIYVELYKKPLNVVTGTHFGVCSEIAAFVIKREDVNLSFLCHGARRYGKFKDSELLCGIPKKMVKEMFSMLIKEDSNKKGIVN
jgi:uncharacterized protein (DUF169 family)